MEILRVVPNTEGCHGDPAESKGGPRVSLEQRTRCHGEAFAGAFIKNCMTFLRCRPVKSSRCARKSRRGRSTAAFGRHGDAEGLLRPFEKASQHFSTIFTTWQDVRLPALARHSCVPSATYTIWGDVLIARAARPLKAGDEARATGCRSPDKACRHRTSDFWMSPLAQCVFLFFLIHFKGDIMPHAISAR